MTLDEIEENVRSNGSVLTDGAAQVAALYYVDPRRFSNDDNDVDLTAGLTARVLEQNMTVSAPESITPQTRRVCRRHHPGAPGHADRQGDDGLGLSRAAGQGPVRAISSPLIGSDDLSKGDVLRIGILQKGEQAKIIRASVYRGTSHLITVALDDHGRFVAGREPPQLDAVTTAFDDNSTSVPSNQNLPRVYDGIYRAALSYGMTKDMTALIIKLLASSVDFEAELKPHRILWRPSSRSTDSSGQATEDLELSMSNAALRRHPDAVLPLPGSGRRLDRLLRPGRQEHPPIPAAQPGSERHLQVRLRHAPAPDPGLCPHAYGRRLGRTPRHARSSPPATAPSRRPAGIPAATATRRIVRHANGYESSYNHQSAIAKGIVPGAKVRQGQVIGWVGTTGESTGPHLHYEMIVNGTKVDPLRVRLPGGKSLKGEALAKFEDERKRIDTLLGNSGRPPQVAEPIGRRSGSGHENGGRAPPSAF